MTVKGKSRKTYSTNRDECPRCKKNDLIHYLKSSSGIIKNILDWYARNTTYTKEQIESATHECNRCNILFIVNKK